MPGASDLKAHKEKRQKESGKVVASGPSEKDTKKAPPKESLIRIELPSSVFEFTEGLPLKGSISLQVS